METAWALGMDYGGYEGQRPPLTLFKTKEDAEAAQKIATRTYGTGTYLVEVPYWPDVRDD